MGIENEKNRYFHVTPKRNLVSILSEGLHPTIGERSEKIGEREEAIYLFRSFEDMDNALFNWLGEAFEEEDDDLVILQIDEIRERTPRL